MAAAPASIYCLYWTRYNHVGSEAIMTTSDPIISKLRKALDGVYGPRLERVVLFGSHARGDARADSDYDIAIFLHDLAGRYREVDRLAELQDRVMADADPFIDAIPFPAGAWTRRTTFMHECGAKASIYDTGSKSSSRPRGRLSE
jgi:predicted nucleotidyltransferase